MKIELELPDDYHLPMIVVAKATRVVVDGKLVKDRFGLVEEDGSED